MPPNPPKADLDVKTSQRREQTERRLQYKDIPLRKDMLHSRIPRQCLQQHLDKCGRTVKWMISHWTVRYFPFTLAAVSHTTLTHDISAFWKLSHDLFISCTSITFGAKMLLHTNYTIHVICFSVLFSVYKPLYKFGLLLFLWVSKKNYGKNDWPDFH